MRRYLIEAIIDAGGDDNLVIYFIWPYVAICINTLAESIIINFNHCHQPKPPLEGVESATRLKVLILISDQAFI